MAGNPEAPETAGPDSSAAAKTAVDTSGEAPEEVSLEIPRDAFDIALPDHGLTLDDFSSAVFAPLLAFVLGYYFGEKQQGSGGA